MQNIVINMCENFRNNRSKNDGALEGWKADNKNPNKNNVRGHWGPVTGGSKIICRICWLIN